MFNSKSKKVVEFTAGTYTKTLTFSGPVILNGVTAKYVSDATVATRTVTMLLKNAAGTEIGRWIAGNTQAASLTYYYNFYPSCPVNTTVANTQFNITIPFQMVVPAGYSVVIYDKTNTTAGDAVTCTAFVEDF